MYRAEAPEGPFVAADHGVVEGIAYFEDAGLLEDTVYYFCVTAIDVSGNESVASATLELSTNPPSLLGWPLTGGEPNFGTPAAVDLDMDGDLEILIGSGDVYCWHHDGVEYMDGDGDTRTHGIFTIDGLGGYRSSLALGEMDGDFFPEFVGASWGNFGTEVDPDYRVFAWNAEDGSLLDGWPVSTGGLCWATPSLGDLDGDGLDDVVLPCADGFLYAWQSDGEELIDGDVDPLTTGVFADLMSSWQFGSAALVDLDQDEALEIVVPSRAESVYVFEADGTRVPGWPIWCDGAVLSSVCAADVDADGIPEIIVAANGGNLFVLSAAGDTLPGWPVPVSVTGDFPASPTAADLDGDDELEIIQVDEDGLVHVYTWAGEVFGTWPQSTAPAQGQPRSSVSVGDVDGDGLPDLVVGDNMGCVYAFHANGDVIPGWPIVTGGEIFSSPTLADLDLDGDVEVVIAGTDEKIYVWDVDGDYADGEGVEWSTFRHDAQRTGNYGHGTYTGVDGEAGTVGSSLVLEQNHPNPFNPVTTIAYTVPSDATDFELTVYNVAGQLVTTLDSGAVEPGRRVAVWNGRDAGGEPAASGVYFIRLAADGRAVSRKVVLLK